MRIALVGPTHPYKGGIAQHTTLLAHRLAARGHNVDLVSWRHQYPARLYPGEQRVPGSVPEGRPFPATRYPLDWWRPDGWWRTGRSLRRHDAIVLVHVTTVQAPAYLALVTAARGPKRSGPKRSGPKRSGPALVALVHNVMPHEPRPGDRALVRALLGRADGVLVHSLEQQEQARANGAAVTEAVQLPALLEFDAPTAPPSPRPEVARRLLFFGLVRPYKGLDVLLRAMADVPDVGLVVAGEFWGGTGATEELVAELGLTDRVELRPGYVAAPEVPALFGAVDALVLPYRSATSSGNVRLAFEHGVPVVASAVGDLPLRVRDGVDGVLVPPDDPAALAGALRGLYAPGEAERLRSGVLPPDPDGGWGGYVEAVERLTGR